MRVQVSIHVPARGTTHSSFPIHHPYECFNPRSRTGNDPAPLHPYPLEAVSIHVPARGTTWRKHTDTFATMFQSTFPHGERRKSVILMPIKNPVSIHVPARGTTSILRRGKMHKEGFNPRSRTGNDDNTMVFISVSFLFQSTFPHGERPECQVLFLHFIQFQSTFPHGERRQRDYYIIPSSIHVSIHVPARGTTVYTINTGIVCKCFNPRSRTGNDISSLIL